MKNPKELEKELCEFWSIEALVFFAEYAINPKNQSGYFRNIRKLDGSRCFYPDQKRVTISVPRGNYEIGKDYKINAFVPTKQVRADKRRKYLLFLDTRNNPPELFQTTPEAFVRNLENEYRSTKGIAKNTLIGALNRLSSETNKKAETFIYEIIQNADDYPDPVTKQVKIYFKIDGQNLIVLHDGLPFEERHVYAICTVGSGDKASDPKKTGFKGIGFKSIFKHSNFVWIHSGGFSFRFDEMAHRVKGEETVWQVIPLWTAPHNNFIDSSNRQRFHSSPVSFAIRPKEGRQRLDEYERIFLDVFEDERVLLFLRAVRSLTFEGIETSFQKEISEEKWEISNLPALDVPEDLREKINQIVVNNQDERIPEKFDNISSTIISFATNIESGQIQKTSNTKIYAYLPTDLNFGFPFLVNGDFIPDGSREKLFWDIEWNQFLFKKAGYQFIEWLKMLVKKYDSKSVMDLIPNFKRLIEEELDENKKEFLELFEEGFRDAILEIEFLPDNEGNLRKLSELYLDKTGIKELVGKELFEEIVTPEEIAIDSELSSSRSIQRVMNHYQIGKIFDDDDDWEQILDSEKLISWNSIPTNNIGLISHLIDKGKQHYFENHPLILNNSGTLSKSGDLYLDLQRNEDLIEFLDIPYLHSDLTNKLETDKLNLKTFEVDSFVDEILKSDSKSLINLLNIKQNNLSFFQFLFKYRKDLPERLFSYDNLGNCPVLMTNGVFELVGNAYVYHDRLNELAEKSILPADQLYLISEEFGNEIDWDNFWQKLGAKHYEPSTILDFLSSEIANRISNINEHISNSEDGLGKNKELLEFIWIESKSLIVEKRNEILSKLSNLDIATKHNGWKEIKSCLLSTEYTGSEELESLSGTFSFNGKDEYHFTSAEYLADSQLSKKDWRLLLSLCGIQTDLSGLLNTYILPVLSEIPDDKMIEVTRLLFKYRKEIIGFLNTPDSGFKLKTVSGEWLLPKDTIVGDHYLEVPIFSRVVPSVELSKMVSAEYSTKDLNNWREVFQGLDVITLATEEEVIEYKIKFTIENQTNWVDDSKLREALDDFLMLHQREELKKPHYKNLNNLLLKIKSGEKEYEKASSCYLSSEFLPTLDLESLKESLEDNTSISFVHPSYIRYFPLRDLKTFFRRIGVKDDFHFIEEGNKRRKDIDQYYLQSIENRFSYITGNAQQYGNQHKIEPWIEVPYIDFLKYSEVSLKFWEKVRSDRKLRKAAFEKVKYYCAFRSFTIDPYPLFFVKGKNTFPAKDNHCYKPEDLISFTLSPYTDDPSKQPAVDLSKETVGGIGLEKILGIRQELTLDEILSFLGAPKELKKIKESNLIEQAIQLLQNEANNPNRISLPDGFQLPNQLNEWHLSGELFYFSEDYSIGIGKHERIVHSTYQSLASYLGLKEINERDLEINPINDKLDSSFRNIMSERIPFLAWAESQQNRYQLQSQYAEEMKRFHFHTVERIELILRDEQGAELWKDIDNNFIQNNEDVYYVGHWSGIRAEGLFQFILDTFSFKEVNLKNLKDILLLHKQQLEYFFQERGIPLPEELCLSSTNHPSTASYSNGSSNPSSKRKHNERTGSEIKEPEQFYKASNDEVLSDLGSFSREVFYSKKEEEALTKIFGDNVPENFRKDLNLAALVKGLQYLSGQGYDVSEAERRLPKTHQFALLESISKEGKKYRVICRSAISGLLYLTASTWEQLESESTLLYILIGKEYFQCRLCSSQKEVLDGYANYFVFRLEGDQEPEVLNDSLRGDFERDKMQLIFRMKKSQDYNFIFERIYEKEESDNINNVLIDENADI